MPVARTDIRNSVLSTCRQLEVLKAKIGDELSLVNEQELKGAIDSLRHEVNTLARQVHQSAEFQPLEPQLKKNLLDLVNSIQKSPAFSQAVGALSASLLGLLKEIKTNIKQFENRVTKVDTDPLRKE